jgi:hypothetical protein
MWYARFNGRGEVERLLPMLILKTGGIDIRKGKM